MDIKKVPNANGRFYIHSIKTNKVVTPGNSMNRPLTVTTSNNSIPSGNTTVNNNSMQNTQNNAQNVTIQP